MQRWAETNPSKLFVAVDGNWVEKSEKEGMALKAEKFTLDVYSAFSYTQQAFGALKSEQPKKHELIGEVRTKVNKYIHNCLADLNGKQLGSTKRRTTLSQLGQLLITSTGC
jgi:hypothetical protein